MLEMSPESSHAPNLTGAKRLTTAALRDLLVKSAGNPPFGRMVVRHLCGLDWCLEHLAWGTSQDNQKDLVFHQIHGYGQVAPVEYPPTRSLFSVTLDFECVPLDLQEEMRYFMSDMKMAARPPRQGAKTARTFAYYLLPTLSDPEYVGPHFKEVLDVYIGLMDLFECGDAVLNPTGALRRTLGLKLENRRIMGREWSALYSCIQVVPGSNQIPA